LIRGNQHPQAKDRFYSASISAKQARTYSYTVFIGCNLKQKRVKDLGYLPG